MTEDNEHIYDKGYSRGYDDAYDTAEDSYNKKLAVELKITVKVLEMCVGFGAKAEEARTDYIKQLKERIKNLEEA